MKKRKILKFITNKNTRNIIALTLIFTFLLCVPVKAGVIEDFTEKGDDFIKGALRMFKASLKICFGILGANPTKGEYKDVWKVTKDIYNSFSVIGGSLLTVFFVYGYCRDVVDIRQEMQFETTIKMFIRLIVTSTLMTSFITILPDLFGYAINMLNVTESTSKFSLKMSGTLSDQFGVGTFFVGLIIWLVALACSAMLIWTCFGRFINLFTLIPFGSIALSTIAAGGQVSQTGYSYIKTMLATIFEIVAMGIVLSISMTFLSGSVISDMKGITEGIKMSMVLVECIVKMLAIPVAMKGSDSLIRRALNL